MAVHSERGLHVPGAVIGGYELRAYCSMLLLLQAVLITFASSVAGGNGNVTIIVRDAFHHLLTRKHEPYVYHGSGTQRSDK